LTPTTVLPLNDEALLKALGEGDPDAIGHLYQRYGAKMLAFARRYTSDDGIAEDVVIDLLQRWLERPPSIREFQRLGAFLAASIYHAAVDWIRRDRVEQGQPPRLDADAASRARRHRPGLVSESTPEREELAARLTIALGRLSSSDRLLLESHYGRALTMEECTTLLGISRAAFHQRLHRARLRLARLIDAVGSEERGPHHAG
jgi:RNA polymerase sigma-70 factor, ECF subfamily